MKKLLLIALLAVPAAGYAMIDEADILKAKEKFASLTETSLADDVKCLAGKATSPKLPTSLSEIESVDDVMNGLEAAKNAVMDKVFKDDCGGWPAF
ncbi:hypothetical protein P3447_09150 [Vibrio parahaemolyticus]|nr:hypothetical protein [Vibrio parahaemolyticus]